MDGAGFASLLRSCGARDVAGTDALVDDVVTRYGEPHRRYHTLAHARAVADGVSSIASPSGLSDPRAGLLAAWLHDAIYDTRAVGNEDASAVYASAALGALGVEAGLVERCAELIRVTATHLAETLDEAILCDADLAILATPADVYAGYSRQVREEYDWVPDADFRAGRAAILRTLLARDALYRTPVARRWEAAARSNVEAELAELARV